eukprot:m.43342 g.43342  ORF g.43342 m.43342 type:complete len:355 (+) comp19354_c0_seq1:205-1269(+)
MAKEFTGLRWCLKESTTPLIVYLTIAWIGGITMTSFERSHEQHENIQTLKKIDQLQVVIANLAAAQACILTSESTQELSACTCQIADDDNIEGGSRIDEDCKLLHTMKHATYFLSAHQSSLSPTNHWTRGGAFYFWFTTMSTIGYGSFTPQTENGQLFVSVFGFISVVVFGFVMSKLSTVWDQGLRTLRHNQQLTFFGRTLSDTTASAVVWLTITMVYLVLFASITLTFATDCKPHAIDSAGEAPPLSSHTQHACTPGWIDLGDSPTLLDGLYFAVVSFTTIGFGEYGVKATRHTHDSPNSENLGTDVMFSLLLVVGLMCMTFAISSVSEWILSAMPLTKVKDVSPSSNDKKIN